MATQEDVTANSAAAPVSATINRVTTTIHTFSFPSNSSNDFLLDLNLVGNHYTKLNYIHFSFINAVDNTGKYFTDGASFGGYAHFRFIASSQADALISRYVLPVKDVAVFQDTVLFDSAQYSVVKMSVLNSLVSLFANGFDGAAIGTEIVSATFSIIVSFTDFNKDIYETTPLGIVPRQKK